MKSTTVHIDLADFIWLAMFAWLALEKHPAWWIAAAFVLASWFVPERYRRITIFSWKKKP